MGESWIELTPEHTGAEVDVFCVPHSGAGANYFQPLRRTVPGRVNLVGLRTRGHEARISEPPHSELRPLVAETVDDLLARPLDRPFAILGVCSGAIVAFELVRALRRMRGPSPATLVAVGAQAPAVVDDDARLSSMSTDELVGYLRRAGTDKRILGNEGMMQLIEPVLRADFRIIECHVHEDEEPLATPIVVVAERDRAGLDGLAAWEVETTASFVLMTVPEALVPARMTDRWAAVLSGVVERL
jgi:medium-chain acyl-[acyl-carrier-protein] hydrolase